MENSCAPFNTGNWATCGRNTESGASAQVRTAGIPIGTAVCSSDSVYGVRSSAPVQALTTATTTASARKIERRRADFNMSDDYRLVIEEIKDGGLMERHFSEGD
jgi:hypothetical protein